MKWKVGSPGCMNEDGAHALVLTQLRAGFTR